MARKFRQTFLGHLSASVDEKVLVEQHIALRPEAIEALSQSRSK
jgi:hypothetical protein